MAVALALLVSACSGASPSSVGQGREHGGTAYWAEAPGSRPDFIFPVFPVTDFTLANLGQFQYLMFRPLYWFGQGGASSLDTTLSLARPPRFSNGDTTATVDMRRYRWSNGETVDATDVLFWMNLVHAAKANWAAYVAGGFPENVKSVVVDSPTQLTFTFDKRYNPRWITGNALSQITPLPLAWDIDAPGAAPGSGGCARATYGSADGACTNVYRFLARQAGFDPLNPTAPNQELTTYATNPLWQIVDGPWRLKSFAASGRVVMVPNRAYSGPVKPTLSTFVEEPFSSTEDEVRALLRHELDVGYIPIDSVPRATSHPSVAAGNNPSLADFDLVPLYLPAINYFLYNFQSTGQGGVAGHIISQLYFRQAMQLLINQPAEIRQNFRGYAVPTYGPVPLFPSNDDASGYERANPYPYDPAKAARLLTDHGWRVVPDGTSVCVNAGTAEGQCGAGIPAGAKLDFTLLFADDATGVGPVMRSEAASWARAGIGVTLSGAPSDSVIDDLPACVGTPGCTWEMANLGVGWSFVLDYYPTGEQIFATGAIANTGGYHDTTNDDNIDKTIAGTAPLSQYEDYLADQLPVAYEPNSAAALAEVRHGLGGTSAANLLLTLTPEDWYFQR